MAASLIAPMASSLIQLVASLINATTGKGVRKEGKEQKGGFLPLLVAPLILKAVFGRGYNKMDYMDKNFWSRSIL